ncbi:MAG: hypothetical protein EWV88_06855 [Microcystis wesenbergii Mw_MB_S_20031200_S109D]|uniref:Uncharacterized protein n=1 Tax=Microcystis wesenbergii Mw_MB_S_20031200_S109D TaxID=2486241 RepID=A0A552M0W8_9CHRO|nr:MAG: hypothetical protein EWV88_06855 [Microcystis wesenbergii Mw_MB_S_20031200_S109D]
MTKRTTQRVESWDDRYDDPYRVYQNLLAKVVKKKKLDDEEKAFFKEVESMMKSGELKVVRPGEEGYEDLLVERIKKQHPNKIVDWYKRREEPEWFINYLNDLNSWLLQNTDKTEQDYQAEKKVSFVWFEDEFEYGRVILWDGDKNKTFALLKFS